jgi:catalase
MHYIHVHIKAAELGGTDPDYATHDLYNAIASGNFPSWTAYIQVRTTTVL